MSLPSIEFEGIWKKFSTGQMWDSLRDLVPALTKKAVFGQAAENLGAKEFWAVRDVSFKVEQGEAFGVIGPNGAGKSTILKLLSRILKPTRGTYAVRGRLSALIEVGAGFHSDLTGRENVYLNGTILGMKRKDIDQRFDAIVDFSEIEAFIDTPVKRYSSGMYARLGFAVAIHMDPEILLVDEVLSVGDIGFQTKCLDRMQEIIRNGTTVVFVSHNIRQVARLCDRVLVLAKGEVRHCGDPSLAMAVYHEHAAGRAHPGQAAKNTQFGTVTVRPIDANGQVVEALPFGEPIRFRLECQLAPLLQPCHVNIKVGNYSDHDFFVVHSETAEIVVSPGQTTLFCELHHCRLLPNHYQVRAYLSDRLTGRVIVGFPHQQDLFIGMPDGAVALQLDDTKRVAFHIESSWKTESSVPVPIPSGGFSGGLFSDPPG
jgi:lipopolysaccharide transport system ATP-binding protein